MTQATQSQANWTVRFPLDGDMLTERDGEVRDGKLHIVVELDVPDERALRVNGAPVRPQDGICRADVTLEGYSNTIVIDDDKQPGAGQTIVVYWLRRATSKFRLSVDDSIWFLQDIAQQRDAYRSIFDNPYLAVFKEAHDTYGLKVQFNLYDRTDGFDLSQMPERFKPEWQANADWLRLTFHALQNDPPKPYEHASPEQLLVDCERVTGQIVRFAGAELLDPATTIHWGAVTREGCRALRSFGMKGLAGYFRVEDGKPIVSYYLSNEQTAHLEKRDFWKDHSEDLVFVKIDAVLDRLQLDEVVPALERIKSLPHESGFLDVMVHEQYYYPHYSAYQPDYRDKIMATARWAAENGYEPAFLSECLFE
ncbi:hypothetical protein ACFFNY_07820 [Paenibacillus hodogayensis]|uniref:Uncharacterized protein n=1 Tax=Paenibacillus hodogayensis TaxID=279208 RepID=A0ABV5VT83_9BACL